MALFELGELCTWAKGASIPRDDTNQSSECAYLHYGDLYKKYDFRLNLDEKYKEIIRIGDTSKIKSEQYLHTGDIVFALTSETIDDLGHCTLIINDSDKLFVSGMETTAIHIKNQKEVLPAYLNYYFHSMHFQHLLRQYVTGMKVYRVHPKDLMKIKIDLPDYGKQEKVVGVLDAISDKMALNSKINDNLFSTLRSYYYQLISGNCSPALLKDIATVESGKRPELIADKKTDNVTIPVIGASKIMGYTTKAMYNERLLITGRVGTHGVIQRFSKEIWPSDNTLVIKTQHYEFIYQVLKSVDYLALNRGSTQPLITQNDLKNTEIWWPENDNLERYEKTIHPITTMIEFIQDENESLINLRDYLLPKLMSGEIDVSSLADSQLNNHLSEVNEPKSQ